MIVLTFAECTVDQAGSKNWPEKNCDWLGDGKQVVLLANQYVNQDVFKSQRKRNSEERKPFSKQTRQLWTNKAAPRAQTFAKQLTSPHIVTCPQN